jgi:predicted GNAT family acetyltransferase
MSAATKVVNDPAASQFQASTDAGLARLSYVARGDTLDLVHTEVPIEQEGKGVGSALARAALEHARTHRLKVVASCPFVASYVERHPEYRDVVAAR